MTDHFQFADKLRHYIKPTAYSTGQLATLADLPKTTIVNWLNGRVQSPRDWQPLVKLLTVLHLEETEADDILQAANHPTIAELRLLAKEQDQRLLTGWERPYSPADTTRRAPFQAIADLPYFVGRQTIQAELKKHLLNPDLIPVCVLQGMAGTGKTSLAARIAYDLRPHFPDGVLWARLDTSNTLMILHTFAQAYGADVGQYDDIDSRSRVVRDLLADRRVLIVLDNAMSSSAVEPLLPPTGQSAVLITTRRHDLRVAQSANRFNLLPFQAGSAASRQFFAHFLGEVRANLDSEQLDEIAANIGYLPLALAIVAGRLAYEPGWSAADFLARLEKASYRLNELQSEDQNVRLSFAASYELAPPEVQSFFATLSFFGGKDFSPDAAAAAANVTLNIAQDHLRMLYRLSLVQSGRTGRFQLHPLLQDYAREKLPETADWTPLINYYLEFLNNHNLGDSSVALETDNILATITSAFENGETAGSVELVIAFTPFLKMQGLFNEAQRYLSQALDTAGAGQRLPILLHLSQTARYYRRFNDADTYLTEADILAHEKQDIYHQSFIEAEKGIICGCLGDHDGARNHFRAGLALARQNAEPLMLVSLLKELGASEVAHGNYETAEALYQEALTLARQASPAHVPMLLRCLGGIAIGRDNNFTLAGSYYEEGLPLAKTMNNQEDIIFLLNNLAAVAFQQGRFDRATALLKEGLSFARPIRHRVANAMLGGNLGRVAIGQQNWELAQRCLEEALETATAVKHRDMAAALQVALGLLAGRQKNFQTAENHFQTAITNSRQISYHYGVLQAVVGWGWLSRMEGNASLTSRYLNVFQELAQEFEFARIPEDYGTPDDLAFLERPKIVYD